jgi:hypothetical protein
MPEYEYRVIAAPTRGAKAKGIRSAEARFAHAMEQVFNAMASEGWEYQRAETLPSVERSGLTSTTTNWRNLLVFRRLRPDAVQDADTAPAILAHETQETDETSEHAPARDDIPGTGKPEAPQDGASEREGTSRMQRDNVTDDVNDVAGLTNALEQVADNRKSSKADHD